MDIDHGLTELMLDQVIRGNRVGETFTEQAYSDMAESSNAKFRLQADMFILENRYINTDDEKN